MKKILFREEIINGNSSLLGIYLDEKDNPIKFGNRGGISVFSKEEGHSSASLDYINELTFSIEEGAHKKKIIDLFGYILSVSKSKHYSIAYNAPAFKENIKEALNLQEHASDMMESCRQCILENKPFKVTHDALYLPLDATYGRQAILDNQEVVSIYNTSFAKFPLYDDEKSPSSIRKGLKFFLDREVEIQDTLIEKEILDIDRETLITWENSACTVYADLSPGEAVKKASPLVELSIEPSPDMTSKEVNEKEQTIIKK